METGTSKSKLSTKRKVAIATVAAATVAAGLKFGFSISNTTSSNLGQEAVQEQRDVGRDDNSNNVRKKITTGNITSENVTFE